METSINKKNYNCPVEYTLDVVAGKWKALIMWNLRSGRKRFNELQRLIPDITHKMLIQKLKELESHALISKQVYAQVPPKVEYYITEHGETLFPILDMMSTWAFEKRND